MRRIHTPTLFIGDISLEKSEAHHARDVLRLAPGTTVEIFDDAGQVAEGTLIEAGESLGVRVERFRDANSSAPKVVIASAIPKGDRADWMVEKLSELGVSRFVPLITTRSIVVPAGKNKLDRWNRLAIESAKQSRRAGVMQIAPVTELADALKTSERGGIFFSTEIQTSPLRTIGTPLASPVHLFIGPEGGWTDEELAAFRSVGLTPATLGATILRIETAAIAAAAIVQSLLQHE